VGGGEFAILVDGSADTDEVAGVAKAVLDTLDSPVEINGHALGSRRASVSSIGR
jgi:predicted signal transduction protein with EAL and GGDEF domain